MQGGSDDQDLVTGINVTPLVDITLVLLIIFMVTATFVSEQGLQVNLPKAATQEAAPSPAITVSLGAQGELLLMKKPVDLKELARQMSREVRIDPAVKVLVRAHKDLPYYRVAEVLDAIKGAGVAKAALAMDKK
ncbi:MAG: biopolymer transporter ExbD [candidate division FCPU426 bacterium]